MHRVDYSQELLRLAVSEDLPGVPAKLHLNTEVTSVDCASATLHLKNGESRSFDLVIGTDGLYVGFFLHISLGMRGTKYLHE
jgi:2-polyprenyl-6-methoxyphenol hydroxylase-like FAD-dependent oxidoreductase